MKKFYTILAAAAVTLSASAVKPITEILPANSAEVTVSKSANFAVADAKKSVRAGQKYKVQGESRAAATVDDITEWPYAGEFYSLGTANSGWNGPNTMLVIPVEGNQVMITGLWHQNLRLTGTYDAAQGTISIPAKQNFTVNTQAGEATCTVALLDVKSSPYKQLDKDIVLNVDAANRNIWYDAETYTANDGNAYYAEIIGMCTDAGTYYDFIGSIDAYMFNSYMDWVYAVTDANDQIQPAQASAPIWVEVADGKIGIDNFLNAGYTAATVELTLDKAAKTATATKALLGQASVSATQKVSFYLWGFEEVGENLSVTPTVVFEGAAAQYEDGTPCTVFTTPYCGIFDETGNYYLSDENYTAISTQFVVDGDVFSGAGIGNVTVADENAPVEYFNLQGVRVENPSNGLYIRRQGNTATKVLVK